MFGGAFALLERSLRIDSRSRSTHLIRVALVGAIYLAMSGVWAMADLYGAPGLWFFRWIVYLDLIFLTLLGIGFFSTVITEEKEEDTLGLILMAGISPWGILTGKSLGGLCQSILLIAVQYPFILLAVTMGGVTTHQVWTVTVAFISYVFFLAGLGLFFSTICPRSRTAAWLMGLVIFLHAVLSGIAIGMSIEHQMEVGRGEHTGGFLAYFWTFLQFFGSSSIFVQVPNILSSSFGDSAFSIQVISNLLAGALCAGCARLFFGLATRSPSGEAQSRGLVARRRAFFRFTAGRSWKNPFLWKDFHFVAGGSVMTFLRMLYFGGWGILPFVIEIASPEYADFSGQWIGISMFMIMFSASISAANVLARSLQDEIRGQTLPALMMLPCSSTGMVYSKFGGALLGWLPGPVAGSVALLASQTFREGLGELGSSGFLNLLNVLLALYMYGMFFVLIPHFAAFLSLYVRWGAVPMAIAVSCGVYFGMAILSGLFSFFLYGQEGIQFVLGGILLLSLACFSHIAILLRVQALAARG